MAEGPFANAGLGMFGTEKTYMSAAMKPAEDDKQGQQGGNPLGTFLAGLIGLSSQQPGASVPGAATPPTGASANPVAPVGLAPLPPLPPFAPYKPLPVNQPSSAATINKLLWGN